MSALNRTPLIIANWKMHMVSEECKTFFQDLLTLLPEELDRDIVICPPFTLLRSAAAAAKKRFGIGAQDLFWETKGAYTGEVSAPMLLDAGCTYVLVAHSERRGLFGETNESANKKVKSALEHGMKPVLCVGETLKEMEAGLAQNVVKTQISEGLNNIALQDSGKLALAYEPVWAIGTGKADSPEQSNKTIGFIRSVLSDIFGYERAQKIQILYGGSVKPGNIDSFMSQPEIDGALVGGASLNAESFSRIAQFRTVPVCPPLH